MGYGLVLPNLPDVASDINLRKWPREFGSAIPDCACVCACTRAHTHIFAHDCVLRA
jgi:hypothetical protein